jgi:hypothetical protein
VKAVERTLISQAVFDDLNRHIMKEIQTHHQREPLTRGLPKEVLRERFFGGASPDFFRAIIAELESAGSLVAEKEIVRLREHTLELSPKMRGCAMRWRRSISSPGWRRRRFRRP